MCSSGEIISHVKWATRVHSSSFSLEWEVITVTCICSKKHAAFGTHIVSQKILNIFCRRLKMLPAFTRSTIPIYLKHPPSPATFIPGIIINTAIILQWGYCYKSFYINIATFSYHHVCCCRLLYCYDDLII